MTGKADNSLETGRAYACAAGAIEQKLWPAHAEKLVIAEKADARALCSLLLAFGLLAGAFAGALMGHSFEREGVPRTWSECVGANPLWRGFCAFCGGVAVMFGVRLSGGGLIDHGLIGVMCLSLSGWVATASFFMAGCLVARSIYRK